MTQEQKSLLIKDLCARLPYGVKVQDELGRINKLVIGNADLNRLYYNDFSIYSEEKLSLPYLFPLSSLTEGKRNTISQLLLDTQIEFPPYGKLNTKGWDNLFVSSIKQANVLINYCLANHLDINGLIEKGLAIDATGLDIY